MVKFYDLPSKRTNLNLAKAFELIQIIDLNTLPRSMDDAIELYNILRYIDSKSYLYFWSQLERDEFVSFDPAIKNVLNKYFKKIKQEDYMGCVGELDPMYLDDLIGILRQYCPNQRMPEQQLTCLINERKSRLTGSLNN